MNVIHEIQSNDWNASYSQQIQSQAIEACESGKILLLPQLTFQLLLHEEVFFSTEFSHPKFKNISYCSARERVRGAKCDSVHQENLKGMMARYAKSTSDLIDQLFPSYRGVIQSGRTSFRPIEIMDRVPKSYRKDDTRLHVDAFPMSPTQGKRIFRVFTNINPEGKDRVWRVGEPFQNMATRFLPQVPKPWMGRSLLLNALRLTKSYCTEYDYIMLQFHNQMKADLEYQKNVSQREIRFSPNTSWIVHTDYVSHAAISGQFVLEQTFYLPINAMKYPEFSPLRTLETLTGRPLI